MDKKASTLTIITFVLAVLAVIVYFKKRHKPTLYEKAQRKFNTAVSDATDKAKDIL